MAVCLYTYFSPVVSSHRFEGIRAYREDAERSYLFIWRAQPIGTPDIMSRSQVVPPGQESGAVASHQILVALPGKGALRGGVGSMRLF